MRDEIITNIIEIVKIAENGIPTPLLHIYSVSQNISLIIKHFLDWARQKDIQNGGY